MGRGVGQRTGPSAFGLIEEVHDVKRVRELFLQRVELRPQQDVLLGHVREEQLELGLVRLVRERVRQDLVERCATVW